MLMGILTRTLAFVAALLLALPHGWCCLVGPAGCCSPARQQGRAPARPCGCCSHCGAAGCCCPAAPKHNAPRPPPGKCCCGEQQPTLTPDRHSPPPDLAATQLVLPPPAAGVRLALDIVAETPVFPSPPLNLLQQVWLC
jgi:hypothetical protein